MDISAELWLLFIESFSNRSWTSIRYKCSIDPFRTIGFLDLSTVRTDSIYYSCFFFISSNKFKSPGTNVAVKDIL